MKVLINHELRQKIDNYRRKGGKTSRRATVAKIERFIAFCGCSPGEIGRRHVHVFYENQNFSPTTQRDYFYAINQLWKMLGHKQPPPRPRER